jgi:SAM-dependent methyltransferase
MAAKWEDGYSTTHELLISLTGFLFGPHPEQHIDEIRENRARYAFDHMADALSLSKADTVLDMGSGCGFSARALAPRVKQIHCADVNDDMLAFCKREVAEFANVACHKIQYANFSPLESLGIEKAYSSAVWIHFNFYDMVLNLRALNDILPIGGIIYFDFMDAGKIKNGNFSHLNEHLNWFYNQREDIAKFLQYNSSDAVRSAAELTGFGLKEIQPVWEEMVSATLIKTASPCSRINWPNAAGAA